MFAEFAVAGLGFTEMIRGAVQIGVMSVLVIFFVWETSRREERLAQRVKALEELNANNMSSMLNDTRDVLRDATQAIENNNAILIRINTRIEQLET